ncbi:MAG: molecular chaperone DnaJ [Candidatus ainarchaeum sp.]|nr:molecular chaperone DnaJ [Candidatus ainarchaeum sp.]
MQIIKIKSHSITFIPAKDSFNRRSVIYKNKIVKALEQVGTKRDDIELDLDNNCGKQSKASITWYFNGHKLYYEVSSQKRFVDNLFLVSKVIENEIDFVLNEKKPIEEFVSEFVEEDDVHDERKEARKFFEVDLDHKDINEINRKYKLLAKDLHPDMPKGDVEKFKQLNHHHKILKRELA